MEQIIPLLEKLAIKFGVTIEYFYPKYIQFIVIDAIGDLIFCSGLAYVLFSIRHKIDNLWEHDYDRDTGRVFLYGLLGLAIALLLGVAVDQIRILISPEGYLVHNILTKK